MQPIEQPMTPPPTDWPSWLAKLYPSTYSAPLAPYHADLWDHLWATNHAHQPRPYIACWARGWAKSTNTEIATIALGRPDNPGGPRTRHRRTSQRYGKRHDTGPRNPGDESGRGVHRRS